MPIRDRRNRLIWALGFANAPLLYGLAAASVPILIHLLNRRKFREVPWAAMRFLLAAIRKNQRRIRIEQWLLLAVRTLIILLVVAAMAKPFLESAGHGRSPGQRTHRVLVLDALAEHGLHRGRRRAGSTRPRPWPPQLVKDSRRGDAISVDPDGRAAPGRHRRPVATTSRRSRRRSTSWRSPTAAPT